MHSLHDVHKITHELVMSACVIQLENHWAGLDEIWCGHAIGTNVE
jgi:hypothetical protein